MNITIPGRCHLVYHWNKVFYFTMWLFNYRIHASFTVNKYDAS